MVKEEQREQQLALFVFILSLSFSLCVYACMCTDSKATSYFPAIPSVPRIRE